MVGAATLYLRQGSCVTEAGRTPAVPCDPTPAAGVQRPTYLVGVTRARETRGYIELRTSWKGVAFHPA